ncbi:MAG: helix-turn-helix domain-containing protein [Brevundimonas sp.]
MTDGAGDRTPDQGSGHEPGHEQCGKVVEMISRLGDRWTLPVMLALRSRPHRFNELRRSVDGVSQQMLTRTLKILERDGMLTRTVLPTVPPQVEYGLTDLGGELAGEGARLGDWAFARLAEIEASRETYDADPA